MVQGVVETAKGETVSTVTIVVPAPGLIPSRSSVHETCRLERPGGTFQNQR